MRLRSFAGVVAALFFAILPFSAQALDQRFTDSDGDMVADTPKDPKALIDPPVLIFSYTPVEDPAVYAKVWDGFIRHMEKVTGKKVQFFPVQSNAAQLEAMRAGRLHVAGFKTGCQSARGQLRGLRAVRDDVLEGRAVRLRDGDHHLSWQRRDQNGGHQGQEAGVHLADIEFGLRRHRPC